MSRIIITLVMQNTESPRETLASIARSCLTEICYHGKFQPTDQKYDKVRQWCNFQPVNQQELSVMQIQEFFKKQYALIQEVLAMDPTQGHTPRDVDLFLNGLFFKHGLFKDETLCHHIKNYFASTKELKKTKAEDLFARMESQLKELDNNLKLLRYECGHADID